MGIFSFFKRSRNSRKPENKCLLKIEALEDRFLPSGNTISGFVFNDVNNNGLFDTGETPLANTQVELFNSNNQIIGTTTTDANGFYQFTQDSTVNTSPQTMTQTLNFPTTTTDFTISQLVNQFNPDLGQLQSIQIIQNGTITSTIKVENTSATSGATINATVSGDMILTGPGFTSDLNLSQNAGTFNATSYDGILDFGGTSGFSFNPKAATGNKSITLTGSQLAAFIGAGQVSLTESATATSSATGGGNLVASLSSNGQATVSVVYDYLPSNALKPGSYRIVLPTQPASFLPGKESSGGTVLSVPPGTNSIPVTLTTGDSVNNDFGELVPSALAGTVFLDSNDDGILDNGEHGLPGVQLTLSGTDDTGAAVSQILSTNPAGAFQFTNLRPGQYTISESPPAGYLDGKITVGSAGGTVGSHQITNINLNQGTSGTGNNFAELTAGGLSGFVYFDANSNGVKDSGETGISGVTVTLTGTDDHGAVHLVTTTDSSGAYQFANLRPGSYVITETPPANYAEGQNAVGSLGGTVSKDAFSGIALAMGALGTDYDFAEIQEADLSIQKTASSPKVLVGDTFTYTLTVSNNGPTAAQNVVVTDNLPQGEVFLGGSGQGWTVNNANGVVSATIGSLASGTSSVITITVEAPLTTGNITNTATVSSQTNDQNPINNSGSVTTTIFDVPTQVFPKTITPLQTMPFVFSKIQLIGTGGAQYLDPNLVGRLSFVDGVFRTLLGRPASAAEQLFWSNKLAQGTSAGQFVHTLWLNPTHLAREVIQTYQTVLNRAPTHSELMAGISSLQLGLTQTNLMYNLLTSPEFQAAHATAESYILGFYRNVLGEVPSASTRIGLVQSMGASTVNTMAQTLLSSTAAFNEIVIDGYIQVLHRMPTQAELQTWSSRLQGNQITQDAFVQQLLLSNEFRNLARTSARY
jgi:uncharacterized repeat protein (TIGR01451 family)